MKIKCKSDLSSITLLEGLYWLHILLGSDASFSMEEIRKVVFSLEGGDAVDLDGFIMAFFQENWELIKEDIDEVLSEFHKCGIITSSLNETCVIPKKAIAYRAEDVTLVSLITNLCKVIGEVFLDRFRWSSMTKFLSAFIIRLTDYR